MRKIKNILILAAGDSTRFWPLSKKSYFIFLGKPLILHLIEEVKDLTENILVVINPEDAKSINQLNANKIKVVTQKKELQGQAGAILSTKGKIKGEVLILNAEDIFNFGILHKCIDRIVQTNTNLLFVSLKVKDYFPGGYLKFKNNKISEIVEKPNPDKVPSNKIKLVIDYYSDFELLVDALENTKSNQDNQYEQAINKLLIQNTKAEYILYSDYWYPLKYPWQVLPIMKYFLSTMGNEIKLGKNVKIAKTAKIVGPCFIDDNTVVGDFAMIVNSHIGKNCLIGGYSEVTRSYLGDDVFLHRNYIGDSVLGNNVLFGAEATTANFRFDGNSIKSSIGEKRLDTNLIKLGAIIGDHSKIGVNSTLLPGVKVGRHTFIAPGHTIAQDVEDDMFVKRKLRKNLDQL